MAPLAIACSYRFPGSDIRVEFRGDNRWAITRDGSCLNRLGEWEYEPLPSSRDEEYLGRNRYSRDEAIEIASDYICKTINTFLACPNWIRDIYGD